MCALGWLLMPWIDPERALRDLHERYNTVKIGRSAGIWYCTAYDRFQLNNDDTYNGYGHSVVEAVMNCWLCWELDDAV